ncbi:MAG: Trk family potassium uptake protein [Lachnospiraceae bacterium]|nr:Trk family potassium uptake protein [Lachnospiraceae bacterium]MDE7201389.1 Trk family potassium uptake protein [Lachnospiraceae bacterium]
MVLEFNNKKPKAKKSTTRLIASGFVLIILAGALLLTLPIANKSGHGNLLNSLFTATSATCVTGLIVADTYQNWTTFGQIVILCMIQVGGLGFMTIGAYISVLLKKRIGLQEREQLQESVNTLEIAGVVRLVKKIVQGALCIEGLGTVVLAFRFIPRFGAVRGIYFSIFHAVSAFCNGGFDLMGVNEAYSSLAAFEGDIVVNLVVVTLILVGGIGFIVWDDVMRNKWHFRKYLLHSKIVITTTLVLTAVGTILFLITENQAAFAGMSPLEKFLGALFSSVTPRTAGFNSVDTAALSNSGKIITMVLMFIGGSPGSTAGGAKTTTMVVLLFYAVAMVLNKEDINLFGRRLTDEVVKKANAVVVINATLTIIATITIMTLQPLLNFEDVLFEVLSAIGTAGMTVGITRELNMISRVIIIVLMYCGRLGSLSFALIFAQKKTSASVRQPQEKIIVG